MNVHENGRSTLLNNRSGMTLTEKILSRASGRTSVSPGEVVFVNIDILMSHDPCTPGVASVFKKEFGEKAKVWNPDRFIMIPDHFIYSADPQANQNIRVMREFAKEQGITHFYDVSTEGYKGVCHIGLAEGGHTRPGEVLLGTDSHTVTAGAFGTFAIGVGITDGAYALGTGEIPLLVPATIKVNYYGKKPKSVQAKDLILLLMKELGVSGATYNAIEFSGNVIDELTVEERMTMCNMVVECGAKNGIMVPNQATLDYLSTRTSIPFTIITPDKDAQYSRTIDIDVTGLTSMIARPHSPDNVVPITQLENIAISQAYIGSCTGGKTTDFIAAAHILFERKVIIPTYAVPTTKEVFHNLITTYINGISVYEILTRSGVKLSSEPGCAACCGGPADTFGRVREPVSVISTTNRNFVGRMGNKGAMIYLASPYAVAAAAVSGFITNPERYLTNV
ncbi:MULTISPECIES: 3-isopropylmalate dehydratase large subunit [Tenebrionibacter/Tenebrionicola group]|jgi:3-isopropylmalate/(R)-2-methylmalate dehydratase large subunit|uniref:3-isopropylmalate dehydratase large subunit n=2 Tax=Tenebrionibacter/Tenebrionicola group TaxID=2969848 RepID=A0A8K0V4J1_9ENTR|nr:MULTISPECIES: aconitase/3-isopropylmalate dehydratase large subunit family protein [Tenebrionibacter/Tenebrionicola group]MBK4716651.1 3-isopropylmalate dehydratase large subunit [Tenebrionibacter intestinalis]MBV5097325.1 3-isopropylmalate dehydratase large subunit [Tenebrionicola larvae]